MNSGFCGIPGMSQPRLDRCEGCAHNKGLFALDCEDFEPSPGGDAQ